MITVSNEDCIDTFNYSVLPSTEPFENSGCDWVSLDLVLSDKDKDLLEDYAPKLFNTLPNPKDLHDAMLSWTTLVHNYRNDQSQVKFVDNIYNKYPEYLSSKKDDKKIEMFKKNIKKIHDLMGGFTVSTKAGSDLKKALEAAYANPDDYFTNKPIISSNKALIFDYLTGLNLPDKTEIIKEFIKKLSN